MMKLQQSQQGRTARIWTLVAALSLIMGACATDQEGGDDTGTTADVTDDTGTEEGTGEAEDETTPTTAALGGEEMDAGGVINMVLSPDPVWDWLNDQGIREEMEQEAGMQILASSTWDRFGVYAGGHADVMSVPTYEVPDVVEGTGVPTTIFGKYNADRTLILAAADSGYEDICDLEGERIVSYSFVSATIGWGVLAQAMCDLELGEDSTDFELAVTGIQQMAEVVASGDAAACICPPEFAIEQLTSGELVALHDNRGLTQLFSDEFGEEGTRHPQLNVFVAPTAWVDANPEEVALVLDVWDRGLQEWDENRAEIISTYPQHFAADSEEDVEFVLDWVENRFDWFEDSAYFDEGWVEAEQEIFDLMQESGYLEEDAALPTFQPIEPPG